ncbi:MAG: MobA-like transferase domain containing protein [Pelosinus sp.]|jgi:molybdenum cofactor cytidylyltransferase|nr:MobA-like transferase domain containing protein [Pelosinus sp.]
MNGIGIVILAAGFAKRMGKQKLLLPLGEKPILAHVITNSASTPWADRIVVIGDPQEELSTLCTQYHIPYIYNSQRHTGQASSITLSLKILRTDLEGILFVLGDQPFVSESLLQALVNTFRSRESNKSIVVSQHQGQRYSPTLFGSWWRPHLAALSGDLGGRTLIRKNPDYVIPIEWPDKHPFYDADTWEDYQFLCKLWNNRAYN